MFWILLSLAVLILFYLTCIKPYRHWTRKGIKQGNRWLIGEMLSALFSKRSFAEIVQDNYNEFPDQRYSGTYQFKRPMLVIRDIDLIKKITVKDFDHFVDHLNMIPADTEPLWTRNLFALKGTQWRDMRATLSPAFTSSKMRAMFALMSECAEEFTKYFEEQQPEINSIELKNVFTRYANDVIATCAFGIKCDSLRQPRNEFYLMGKSATDFTGIWRNVKLMLNVVVPKLGKILGNSFFDKKVSAFFRGVVKDTLKLREETNLVRPDMIHLLMEARKGRLNYEESSTGKETGFATVEESEVGKTGKTVKGEITDDDITAQALIFFFAGFDGVATLMTLIGYELAVNPDIQQKLQNEIDDVLSDSDGKITYETVNKMKYLDMVTTEALRKWPGGIATDRVCVKPYTIPAANPDESSITLNVGDVIWIPSYGIHRDPKYYPDPERFDPQRFSDGNKSKITPYTYLPFGAGPRNCIGSRFALLETKVVFVHLLSKFDIVVTEKTDVPLRLLKTGFSFNNKNGFWAGLKPRT